MAQIAILAVSALSSLNEGAQKRKVKMAEADALGDAANREMAATTAEMAEEQRLKEQMESRAIAVAAASGAGVDDPTMVNLIGDLNAEGEYRIMSRLWVGSTEAEGMRYQAEVARKEGEAALQSGYLNAAKTVMSGYGSFGQMGAEAKSQFGAVKSKFSGMMHGRRSKRSLIGSSMDGTITPYGGGNA